jgi:uncharacterized protein YcgL (UPF0745 family)
MVDQTPSYTSCKRSTFYFLRRVPVDLQAKYRSPRIVMTLGARSEKLARKHANTIATRLDNYWGHIRWADVGIPSEQYFVNHC